MQGGIDGVEGCILHRNKSNDKRVKTITTSGDDWSSGFRAVFEKIPDPYTIRMNEDFFLTNMWIQQKVRNLRENAKVYKKYI